MFGKFLPYSTDFFKYFEKQIDVSLQAAEVLKEMISENSSFQIQKAEKIVVLEKTGDEITRKCIEDLHKTFITPFERNDIYRLITRLDDIIDAIEDVAARIVIYKLDTHKNKVVVQDILVQILLELKKVVYGLRKKEPLESIKPTLLRIHELENKADDWTRDAIGLLFEEEKNPIELIKWKEIYEKLEEATDCCQSVGNIVEGIIMENN